MDEIKDYQKYTSITFIDMLEALGRVADMKNLPLQSNLDAAGKRLPLVPCQIYIPKI